MEEQRTGQRKATTAVTLDRRVTDPPRLLRTNESNVPVVHPIPAKLSTTLFHPVLEQASPDTNAAAERWVPIQRVLKRRASPEFPTRGVAGVGEEGPTRRVREMSMRAVGGGWRVDGLVVLRVLIDAQ